jgi:cytochrome c-type biogenesis protein CcmH
MTAGEDRPPAQPAPLTNDAGQRRGIRTAALSALAIFALVGLAIGILWTSLSPPERSAPGSGTVGGTAGRDSGAGPGGTTIGGTISVAPELRDRLAPGDALFIILRKGPGPPFAVKRVGGPRFPVSYRVGPEDVMMAGTPFEGQVTISARVSKGGGAGPAQPGDLEGEHPGPVTVGARGVDIMISRVR